MVYYGVKYTMEVRMFITLAMNLSVGMFMEEVATTTLPKLAGLY